MANHNLPHASTAFIGRVRDLAEIAQLMKNPACRLLTLVGPGGIGKTRLALESAAQLEAYRDSVYFVPLQPLSSPDHIVSAIAEAVGFQFYQGGEPQQQLLDYFREKALLLILDNFEHLLDGAEIVSNLLVYTANIKIMVTSRETLNLHEEWLYHVQGMRFPENEQVDGVETYSAVRLFTQSAQRVRNDFSPLDEREAIIRICQLVEGTPLALELAAWLKRLPCREIVTEIERGLDILESTVRNVPARHRSMRAVLEQSWSLLAETERDGLKKLSVFRGGFRREAAEQVAGATLGTLSALVDKSMLRVAADGRYDVHELMRQYGEEHLNRSTDESQQARDRHCAYFAAFMREREPDLKGRRQIAALREIEAEFENVRAAWTWALNQKNYIPINDVLESLFLFCEQRGRFVEGMEFFDAAQTQLATAPDPDLRPLWSWVLTRNLWLLIHVSEHIELDKAQLQTCQAIAQEHGDPALVAYCLWLLGHMCLEHDNVAAINYFEQSLKLYSDLDDRFYMAKAADFLGYAYGIIGKQTEHVKFSQQSLDIRRALGDQFGIAGSLFELAGAAMTEGQYAVAERYFREMEAIYHEVGSRAWMVRINDGLALLALQRGDFQSAQTQAEEAIAIIKSIGMPAFMREWIAHIVLSMLADLHEDYAQSWRLCEQGIQWSRVLTGFSHGGFAIAACGLGEFETAKKHYLIALKLDTTANDLLGMTRLLPVAAILLAHEQQYEQATEVLALAFHHPTSPRAWLEAWPLLQRLQNDLRASLTPDVFESAWERGKSSDLETVAKALLVHFDDTLDQSPLTASTHQALLSPLSERELEVLRLVADGLSNPEIAGKLYLSPGTVKVHMRHIYEKLDVNSRVQAAARAKTLNLL